jgi:hypothetical protein
MATLTGLSAASQELTLFLQYRDVRGISELPLSGSATITPIGWPRANRSSLIPSQMLKVSPSGLTDAIVLFSIFVTNFTAISANVLLHNGPNRNLGSLRVYSKSRDPRSVYFALCFRLSHSTIAVTLIISRFRGFILVRSFGSIEQRLTLFLTLIFLLRTLAGTINAADEIWRHLFVGWFLFYSFALLSQFSRTRFDLTVLGVVAVSFYWVAVVKLDVGAVMVVGIIGAVYDVVGIIGVVAVDPDRQRRCVFSVVYCSIGIWGYVVLLFRETGEMGREISGLGEVPVFGFVVTMLEYGHVSVAIAESGYTRESSDNEDGCMGLEEEEEGE